MWGNLTLKNNERIDNDDNGLITFSGQSTGGHNQTFDIDFVDSVAGVTLRSHSTQQPTDLMIFDSQLRMNDNIKFNFGNNDVSFAWLTAGNDGFYTQMTIDESARNGRWTIYTAQGFPATMTALPKMAQPTFVIFGKSTDIDDRIEISHYDSRGVIQVPSGDLLLNSSVEVSFDLNVTQNATIGSTGNPGCISIRDTDDSGWSKLQMLNGAIVNSTGAC